MVELIVVSLAVWRLTSILHDEKISEALRRRIGWDGLGYPDTFLGNLFKCFWCLSVWVGMLCVGLWLVYPPTVYILAASAVGIWIEEVYVRLVEKTT